jgi:hypothetical protein
MSYLGAVFRDENQQLFLLIPHEARAVGIDSHGGQFADIPEDCYDVVRVLGDVDGDEATLQLVARMNCCKPPTDAHRCEAALSEWPNPAHDSIRYFMSDSVLRMQFIQTLHATLDRT